MSSRGTAAKTPATCLVMMLMLALAAGCGKTNPTSATMISVGSVQATREPTSVQGPTLAHQAAASLLHVLEIPSDAVPVSGVPSSSPLASAPEHLASANLVDVHRIWRVPGSARQAVAVIRGERPAGLKISGGGSAGKHGVGEPEVEYLWWVTFKALSPRPGLRSEMLTITTIAAPGGGTLLRADGEAIWISKRPAGERIPAGVSSIGVSRGPYYSHLTLHRTITSPGTVKRVIAAVDALPIVQPGNWMCPEEPVGPVLRLSFRGRAGNILAEADQGAGSEVGDCSPMYFYLRGRAQKSLAQGDTVVGIVSRILGVSLL